MAELLRHICRLLDNGLNKDVFDNLRNFLMCSLLLAAGSSTLTGDGKVFFGLFAAHMAGVGLIALAVFLMLLNMADGLRKLAKARHPLLLQIILCLVYMLLAVRVVEIVWQFRAT